MTENYVTIFNESLTKFVSQGLRKLNTTLIKKEALGLIKLVCSHKRQSIKGIEVS
jgi:hypothetical protein